MSDISYPAAFGTFSGEIPFELVTLLITCSVPVISKTKHIFFGPAFKIPYYCYFLDPLSAFIMFFDA